MSVNFACIVVDTSTAMVYDNLTTYPSTYHRGRRMHGKQNPFGATCLAARRAERSLTGVVPRPERAGLLQAAHILPEPPSDGQRHHQVRKMPRLRLGLRQFPRRVTV